MKERPQEVLRKALPSYVRTVVFKVPLGGRAEMPVKVSPPLPSWSAHDARVEERLSRNLKKLLDDIQKEAEMEMLEGLLQHC